MGTTYFCQDWKNVCQYWKNLVVYIAYGFTGNKNKRATHQKIPQPTCRNFLKIASRKAELDTLLNLVLTNASQAWFDEYPVNNTNLYAELVKLILTRLSSLGI
jgi:hypothetical protein